MKKGFTLVELIVAITITSIVLFMVYSIADVTASIISIHQYQEEFFDETLMVDSVLKNFIDDSIEVNVINNELINEENKILLFDKESSTLYVDGNIILKTKVIDNIEFIKVNHLIIATIWINDTEHITFQYYK